MNEKMKTCATEGKLLPFTFAITLLIISGKHCETDSDVKMVIQMSLQIPRQSKQVNLANPVKLDSQEEGTVFLPKTENQNSTFEEVKAKTKVLKSRQVCVFFYRTVS